MINYYGNEKPIIYNDGIQLYSNKNKFIKNNEYIYKIYYKENFNEVAKNFYDDIIKDISTSI